MFRVVGALLCRMLIARQIDILRQQGVVKRFNLQSPN